MTPAELDYLRNLDSRLRTAQHGGKGAIVQAAAETLHCSRQEVYRKLASIGLGPERKPRADRGKTCVSEKLATTAAGMVLIGDRANGKRTMAIKDALNILSANGIETVDTETGEIKQLTVSASTLARAMRKHNCHPEQLRQPRAAVAQRSLHPNHVWQIDASVCVLFYLPKGGLAVMDEKQFNKNKPGNIKRIEKERVIRYVITDHYSGCLYVEYVLGAETSENIIKVFLNAIQRRGEDDPMHGVPAILMMDAGAANTSALFLNLLDRLNVRHLVHLPGNAQAKGSVEKSQDIVECKFESRLAFHPVSDLDNLNVLAQRWRKAFNATAVHTRYKRNRNAMWLTIKADQLRIAPSPELCRELVNTHPKEVTIRSGIGGPQIHFKTRVYHVQQVPGVVVGGKVQVVVNAYRAPAIDVLIEGDDGKLVAYTVEPIEKDDAGFRTDAATIGEEYKSIADSAVDKRRKEVLQAAYGANTEQEVDAARRAKKPAFEGQIDPFADIDAVSIPTYLPRHGQTLDVGIGTREIAPLNHVEAARQLNAQLKGKWTPERYRWLVQRYPDGVPVEEISNIINQLQGARADTAQPLRMVVGGE